MNQAIALNNRAKMHASQGNTTLAQWMTESAVRFATIQRDIDSFLDTLEDARISSYSHQSSKSSFRTDWYDYEDENLDNWER